MPQHPRPGSAGLTHRPALHGVRALAVIGVLLYHGGLAGIPGGFLGVDVFFVLSGFLITSLLLTEHAANGQIDFGRFWFHRARRLLPALFAVLLFVAAYAALLAPEIVRSRLRGDLIATLAYVANWRFVVAKISYFEQYSTPTPLLHTWSLAIEEQFYLIWPIVVLLLVRWLTGPRATAQLAGLLGVLALASAGLMALLYDPGVDPSRVYYGTDTRAQALLIGALGAVLFTRRGWWGRDARAPVGALAACGLVGLLGVGALYALAHDSAPWMYRGGFLLTALASLALIAGAASPSRSPLTWVLAWPPLRWIGLASYGIYLWHWPVYVLLTPERTGTTGQPLLLVRLAVTGLLATLSYLIIETPIRRWTPTGRGAPWTSLVRARAAGAAIVVALISILATAGPARVAPPNSDALATPSASASSTSADPSASATPVSVFLLGDSVAYGLHSQDKPAPELGVTVSGVTALGCNLFPGNAVIEGRVVPLADNCAPWPAQWREALAAAKPEVGVLMVGNGELYDHRVDGRTLTFGTDAYAEAVTTWLTETTAALGEVAPKLAVTNLPCYSKPDTGLDPTPAIINDTTRQDWLNEVIARFVAAHPEVHLIDLRSFVCPTGAPTPTLNGVVLYKDGVHWSTQGAATVWSWLAGQVRALRDAG